MSTTAEFHSIGSASALNRHTANEALCKFLMLLRFPNSTDLFQLFSCESCTVKDSSGNERMGAVVMDGTALGILGKLPVFERVSSTAPPVPHISKQQFIMKKPKNRAFVDGILISARQNLIDAEFTPNIAPKLRAMRGSLFQRFFEDALVDRDEEYLSSRLLRLCFSTRCTLEKSVGSGEE